MFYATTCVGFRYGPDCHCLAGFLGSLITIAVTSPRRAWCTVPFQHPRWICLPGIYLRGLTHYSVSARMCHCSVASSLYHRVTEFLPFVHRTFASRLVLRSRLTLIRLALIRNPWSFGGRVSRPPYRYLYLHLLFRTLQQGSRLTFGDDRNAPLPINPYGLSPRLRQRTYARLLSMRDHSTSELLRTL